MAEQISVLDLLNTPDPQMQQARETVLDLVKACTLRVLYSASKRAFYLALPYLEEPTTGVMHVFQAGAFQEREDHIASAVAALYGDGA